MFLEILSTAEQSALAGRLKNSDATVLEDILRSFGPVTEHFLARRYPTLKADLEDILAETLERCWLHRVTYHSGQGQLGVWFRRIAQNLANDRLRASGRQPPRDVGATLENIAADTDKKEEPPHLSQQLNDLLDILGQLDERQRRIILRWAQTGGQDTWAAELARELGIPAGSIRVSRHRLFIRIRKAMEARGHVGCATTRR